MGLKACGSGSMQTDYADERCSKQKDGSLQVSCNAPNTQRCSVQFSSSHLTGAGRYSVAMQAAPGAGVLSTLNLYTSSRLKGCTQPGNEISFDVLGLSCSSTETKISTNYVAGAFNTNAIHQDPEPWHQRYITVPF